MDDQWQSVGFAQLSTEELYAILRLRQEIFVVEQNCAYLDLDGLDQQATHLFCRSDRDILAYQRCLPPGARYPESALGRIVVSPQMRGRQLGRELVQRGIDHNRQHWPASDICISAQAHLQDFYGSLGFVAEGEEYIEDNIPHMQMRYRAT